ncbi:MAG: DUF3137 domain-containing protein [Prevotellaceae bacterium]|jgi:hypothetical protein|nr:DUF3137 domain-containing protein [Prevotellaceae bacterium]
MNSTISQLQQELYSTLKQAGCNRRKIRIARTLCYGGALLYFVGIIAMQIFVFSGNGSPFMPDYEANPNPTFFEQNKILVFIIPLFALIMLGSWGLSFYYKKYTDDEQNAVRQIIRGMFPDAKCYLSPAPLSQSLMQQSNFFGSLKSNYSGGYSFGSVVFENNNRKITFRDIVINKGVKENWLVQSSVGGLLLVFQMMFKGLFAKRVENVVGTFRGMFADAQLEKSINGSVVILPDHLESKLDYLAKNIQALKNVNGNKLVMLEDVEFECYFAVYSNDEITARYVLTPAMKLRMTELKKKYNRDIMLSFSGNRFFFAVAMPEGFLTLGNSSLTSGEALKDLYDNFAAVREILTDLKLK